MTSERIDLRRIEDAAPNDVSIDALRAMARAIRAAARINELVGTETEEDQDAAWTELDAALAPFGCGPSEARFAIDSQARLA